MRLSGRLLTIAAAAATIGVPSAIWMAPSAVAANTLVAYANGTGTFAGTSSCEAQATTSNGCSLAEALGHAVSGDTIVLDTPGSTQHYVGNWTVPTSVTIIAGFGVSNPTLDGNSGSSVGCTTSGGCTGAILALADGDTVTVDGVTFTDGDNVEGAGGAIDVADDATGTLTVRNSTFINNTAAELGGAISNGATSGDGTVTVIDSTFTGNESHGSGAGGGAINNGGDGTSASLTVTGSTFNDNDSQIGGAIASGGVANADLTISKSTFYDNAATDGSDIFTGGFEGGTATASIVGTTFTDGRNPPGDTAIAAQLSDVGLVDNSSVTVAGDLFSLACVQGPADWTDLGYNAATTSDTSNGQSCLTPDTATDVVDDLVGDIADLSDNGGPTETDMPSADNPAIGAIPNPTSVGEGVALCPRTDQRGFHSAGACTMGSVEPNGTAPGGGGGQPAPPSVTVTVTSNDNPSHTGDPVTFTATLSPVPDCGSVSWLIDSAPPPAGTPTSGSGATWTMGPISSLSVGVHPVTAVFSGCASFGEGIGTDNQEVDQPATSTPTPTPTPSGTGPTIVAHVTSAHHRHHGWYRSPVHITFTCTQGSAPLTGPCPGEVVLRHDGRHQTVTRTISDTAGRSDSVTVTVNIDRTKPGVSVGGVTAGNTYHHRRHLTCHASDALSGVATCHVHQHRHVRHGVAHYHYVAVATDNAGNKSKTSGSYTIS